MDESYDDERYDSVYANDPVSEFLNVTENFRHQNIDQLLEEDKKINAVKDDRISWYHGKIPREAAESILREGKQNKWPFIASTVQWWKPKKVGVYMSNQ